MKLEVLKSCVVSINKYGLPPSFPLLLVPPDDNHQADQGLLCIEGSHECRELKEKSLLLWFKFMVQVFFHK